jgi:hypothetical protein
MIRRGKGWGGEGCGGLEKGEGLTGDKGEWGEE